MREKREFNFAQQWEAGLARETQNPHYWKTKVLIWGTGSLIFLGGLGSGPWIWEYKVKRDIALVEQQISPLGDIAKQVDRIKTLTAQAEEQQQMLNLMQKNTRDPELVLEELKKALPLGTIVNTFSLQEGALTMGVSVPTPVDVARLWVSLRDSGMFQEVDIQTVSLQDKVQTLNFNLKLKN